MEGGDNMVPPSGLHVLVVDDNPTCLRVLERLLEQCEYTVTITTEAVVALQMIRENVDEYDIVISDVHMPVMDGFDLLENIGLDLDIPVIMLSAHDEPHTVMKGVKYGAVDYLVKPVRLEELQNIWQHIVRRKKNKKDKGKAGGSLTRKGKESDEEGRETDYTDSPKRPRIIWTSDLHRKFVDAVEQLGEAGVFPKKILDMMNIAGLSRENVASHLQKYRIYLKRMKLEAQNQPIPVEVQMQSMYLNDRPLASPYGRYRTLGGDVVNPNDASLLQNSNVSMTGLLNMGPFGYQNNSINSIGSSSTSLQSSEGFVNQPLGIVSSNPLLLADYNARLATWQSSSAARPPAQQNLLNHSQFPSGGFNGNFVSGGARNLRSASERLNLGGANANMRGLQEPLGARNVVNRMEVRGWEDPRAGSTFISSACNGSTPVPNIGSASQIFGQGRSTQFNNNAGGQIFGQGSSTQLNNNASRQIFGQASSNNFNNNAGGTSSFMQDTEVEESDVHYLLDESDVLAEFARMEGGTLEDIVKDIVKGFPK